MGIDFNLTISYTAVDTLYRFWMTGARSVHWEETMGRTVPSAFMMNSPTEWECDSLKILSAAGVGDVNAGVEQEHFVPQFQNRWSRRWIVNSPVY